MKVFMVADYFYPFTPGGAEWSVFEICSSLKKKFTEPVVVTLNYGAADNEIYNGVKIIRLPFTKKLNNSNKVVNPIWQNNPFFFISSLWQLLKLTRLEKPDIIHIHGKYLIPAGVTTGILTNKPVIITIRDKQLICSIGKCFFDPARKKSCGFYEYLTSDFPWFYKNYIERKNIATFTYVLIGSIWARLSSMVIKLFILKADRLVAISRSQKEYMKANGFRNIEVIYNSADFSKQPNQRVRNIRKVIFAGKLSKGKGIEILLEASNKILLKRKVQFLYAGSIDSKKIIDKYLKNKIFKKYSKFLGSIGHSQLNNLYKSASLIVLPSIYPESFGRIPLEALSVGTPAVVTNIGGLSEIIEDKKTGRICSPDVNSLTDAINDVLDHESEYKDQISKSYEQLKEKFYINPIEQHIKLYKGQVK